MLREETNDTMPALAQEQRLGLPLVERQAPRDLLGGVERRRGVDDADGAADDGAGGRGLVRRAPPAEGELREGDDGLCVCFLVAEGGGGEGRGCVCVFFECAEKRKREKRKEEDRRGRGKKVDCAIEGKRNSLLLLPRRFFFLQGADFLPSFFLLELLRERCRSRVLAAACSKRWNLFSSRRLARRLKEDV